jgi:uncharacterized protein (TIGR03083 family)
MRLDRAWLLGAARAEREALGRTIQYTPPDAWDQESVIAGWGNRDIVAVLAATEVAAASAITGEVPPEFAEFTKEHDDLFVLDEFNDWSVRRRAGEPFRAIVREWGRAADLFLARASKASPDEWVERRVPWTAGEIGLRYLVQSRVAEWWIYGEDILQGGGNPPRLEHPPIHCLNDLAIRMVPYALGVAGISLPGRSVRFELYAVGGGAWHWGLAPGEAPPNARSPDAVVRGRAHAFALVAGRRMPAEYYLGEGILQTAGDDALAETVLQHLRVSP